MKFIFKKIFNAFLLLFLAGFLGCIGLLIYLHGSLPEIKMLKNMHMQAPLRVYSADQKLIAEFGDKRRIPVQFEAIPKHLIHAVLSTEDHRFYEHNGVDVMGLFRAAAILATTGKKQQGGSTITMQVARNFFLTRQKSYVRKLKEILLALEIDQYLTKEEILTLYLNKIYLGQRAYGVAAAAEIYYGKKLNELTLAQMAMIAGLPKAPSSINPISNPKRALARRTHVLERMLKFGYINQDEFNFANSAPITAAKHHSAVELNAPYVAEMARQDLVDNLGEDIAYNSGFNIYTTIDSTQQMAANEAIHQGMLSYMKRHGYTRPTENFSSYPIEKAVEALKQVKPIAGILPAMVSDVENKSIYALLSDKTLIHIPWLSLSGTRPLSDSGRLEPKIRSAHDIVKKGDVIRVIKQGNNWQLTQIPDIEGALVAMNPKDGAITALVGGFSFQTSHFNRALQAERQPGSSIKPFIYSAALSKGYTPASIINDSPMVFVDESQGSVWRPQNDNRKFGGPTRLRVALSKSTNIVSVRLADDIGLNYTRNYLQKFGFKEDQLANNLALALGNASASPVDMATAYSVLANGGFKIDPFIIKKITKNQDHETIYESKPLTAPCLNCQEAALLHFNNFETNPAAPQVIPSDIAYQVSSMLRSAVQTGTGRRAKVLKRQDLSGKTGTTNEQIDAWYAGYNYDLVAITWIGHDTPETTNEYGSSGALPIWIDFMKKALKDKPESIQPQPDNIVSTRIDAKSGLLANSHQTDAIFETFRKDLVPTQHAPEQSTNFDTDTNSNNQDLIENIF